MKGVFVDGTWYQFQGIHIEGIPPVDYAHPPQIQKPQITNADRIRAMTDEELAHFLCDLMSADECYKCFAREHCHFGHTGMTDWLKQEASDVS